MKFWPQWLSPTAFAIVTAVMALTNYSEMESLGFSSEAISQFIVSSVVSGVVGGAIVTWLVRRYVGRRKQAGGKKE